MDESESIDQAKLKKMWEKILAYEKNDGMEASDRTAISKIEEIIDEVMKECL